MNYTLQNLNELPLDLKPGDIVFLIGDLWSGKTTLTKEIFFRFKIAPQTVRSPTYTYMQEYEWFNAHGNKQIFHHFDLYRLNDYDDFLNIGGQEYLENSNSIKIIEWPEILFGFIKPNYTIKICCHDWNDSDRQYLIVKN